MAAQGKEVNYLLAGYVLLLLAWILLITGCNPIRKAENRVLADVESVKRVRAKTDELFKCANDTILDFIHDTTITERTDTITHVVNGEPVFGKVVVRDTIRQIRTRTIQQNHIVVDYREQNKGKDTIQALRIELARKDGQILQEQKNVDAAEDQSTIRLWIILGMGVMLILSFVLHLSNFKFPKLW